MKKLLCLYTIGFYDQGTSWSEELCSQQPSLVGDWSRVLESAQLVSHVLGAVHYKENFHYITSPTGYWGKGSTVGYKILGFLYL